MNNIILDTNAFVYLIDYELGKRDSSITLEKKKIDPKKLHDLCTSESCLYVTSQSLYELFWQSVEKGGITDFAIQYDRIAKMRKKYGIGFSVLNAAGCIFDLKKFTSSFFSNSINIGEWVEQKRVYEKEILEYVVFAIYVLPLGTVLTKLPISIEPEYFDIIKANIELNLDAFSKQYYNFTLSVRPSNKDYDAQIDDVLLDCWETTFNMINDVLAKQGEETVYLHDKNSCCSAAEYITTLLKKNKQRGFAKIDEVFYEDLDDYKQKLKELHNMDEVSVSFLKRLIQRCAKEKVKLRKNDGLDFTIVSCLDVDKVRNETDNPFAKNDTVLLTFDNNLYQFIKTSGLMYDENLYNKLM